LARIRFEIVIRFSQNRPFPDFAQMCVKPRKSNVSGLPSPWAALGWAGPRGVQGAARPRAASQYGQVR
jgi:hypothetical protein